MLVGGAGDTVAVADSGGEVSVGPAAVADGGGEVRVGPADVDDGGGEVSVGPGDVGDGGGEVSVGPGEIAVAPRVGVCVADGTLVRDGVTPVGWVKVAEGPLVGKTSTAGRVSVGPLSGWAGGGMPASGLRLARSVCTTAA